MDVRLDDIIDSQLERVSEARDALTDGLSVLTWIHFVFPSSWYCFYWLGKMYFERYLGIYHATSSKHWSTLCKLIFLLTFVTACNLLELMLFEILDLLPPALRRLAWSSGPDTCPKYTSHPYHGGQLYVEAPVSPVGSTWPPERLEEKNKSPFLEDDPLIIWNSQLLHGW